MKNISLNGGLQILNSMICSKSFPFTSIIFCKINLIQIVWHENLIFSSFLKIFVVLVNMSVGVCMWMLVPKKGRGGCQIFQNWYYRWLWISLQAELLSPRIAVLRLNCHLSAPKALILIDLSNCSVTSMELLNLSVPVSSFIRVLDTVEWMY